MSELCTKGILKVVEEWDLNVKHDFERKSAYVWRVYMLKRLTSDYMVRK